MSTITRKKDLHRWAADMLHQLGEPQASMMHLMADGLLRKDEWTLMTLRALEVDWLLYGKETPEGWHLESTPRFAKECGIKVSLTMPHNAFERFGNKGVGVLRFLPRAG